MCFSAAASFGAAGILGIIGLFTVKAVKNKRLLALASVPLFFALQQFSEGVLWLSLQNTITNETIGAAFKYFYLAFAFFIWPIWIPLALFIAEKITWRRILLSILLFFGVMLSLMFVSYLPGNEVFAKISSRKIEYSMKNPFQINQWLIIGWYAAVVILPTLISSLEAVWLFGLALLMSWVVSEQLYHDNFTSTWCFFSALCSILIYVVVSSSCRENSTTHP